MDTREYFEKYGELILNYSFRYLKLHNQKLINDGLMLYKTENKLNTALRNFRRYQKKKVVVKQNLQLNANSITVRKKLIKKTNVNYDINYLLNKVDKSPPEAIIETEETITEKATVAKIIFHSDLTTEVYPVIEQLIKDYQQALQNLQKTHKEDLEKVHKDITDARTHWEETVKPLKTTLQFFNERLEETIDKIRSTEFSNMQLSNINAIVDILCKLADRIAKIEDAFIYKINAKYNIRDRQAKEMALFIEGMVKMQMTIKAMIDNDFNLIEKGYVKKEITANEIVIPEYLQQKMQTAKDNMISKFVVEKKDDLQESDVNDF